MHNPVMPRLADTHTHCVYAYVCICVCVYVIQIFSTLFLRQEVSYGHKNILKITAVCFYVFVRNALSR